MRQKKKFIESVMRNNKTGSNFGSKSQNFPKSKSDRDKTFKKRLIALIIMLTVVPILTGFIMRYFLFSLMYLASITYVPKYSPQDYITLGLCIVSCFVVFLPMCSALILDWKVGSLFATIFYTIAILSCIYIVPKFINENSIININQMSQNLRAFEGQKKEYYKSLNAP